MGERFRRCGYYTRCEIAGVPYLLPFGQKIADHGRGLRVNETSAFLWELLEEERTFEELLELFVREYKAEDGGVPELERDLRTFLDGLRRRGLLEPSGAPPSGDGGRYLRIGGLVLRLCGLEEEGFHPAFRPFLLPEPETPQQTIWVRCEPPDRHVNGTLLLRNEELVVIEAPEYHVLLFPSSQSIREARLWKDGSAAVFYCREALREELFHAVRMVYLYLAQRHGVFALHAASLLYRGRAWLFSGSSGTGKSTHTNLWKELFQVPLLNGDLNLLALRDGAPLVYGLPWCGTSQIFTPETHSLGGIILLKQARENAIEFPTPDQRRLLTMQRLISPFWTEGMFRENLRFVEELEPRILVCRLRCTPEPEAAWTARRAIDGYLEDAGALPLHPATL